MQRQERERVGSCESGEQWHESYRVVGMLAHAIGRLLDYGQVLHAAVVVAASSERKHHAPANVQVREQRARNFSRGRGDQDAVDAKILSERGRAVSVLDAHIVELERAQVASRLCNQRSDALDW